MPTDLTKDKKFTYAVTAGNFEYTDDQGETHELPFTRKTQRMEVKSAYNISIENTVAGEDTKIVVTDKNGKKVRGIGIYMAGGEKIGETDIRGTLTTSKFRDAQKISIYA